MARTCGAYEPDGGADRDDAGLEEHRFDRDQARRAWGVIHGTRTSMYRRRDRRGSTRRWEPKLPSANPEPRGEVRCLTTNPSDLEMARSCIRSCSPYLRTYPNVCSYAWFWSTLRRGRVVTPHLYRGCMDVVRVKMDAGHVWHGLVIGDLQTLCGRRPLRSAIDTATRRRDPFPTSPEYFNEFHLIKVNCIRCTELSQVMGPDCPGHRNPGV